jgi:DNA-nicking Smr family endonuclease
MASNKAAGPALRGASLADLKRLRHQAESQPHTPLPARPSRPAPAGAGALPGGKAAEPSASAAELTGEDIALFRHAVRHVQPLSQEKGRRVVLPPADTPYDILQVRRDRATGAQQKRPTPISDHYTPATLHHDDSSFVRDRHSIQLVKQLQQGRWPPAATLDLHGNTLDQARERLDRFLQSCIEHEIRCARIVHGKGYGSKDGEPVLRTTLRRWLTQIQAVQAYAQCAESQGGAGALDVLLR